MEQRFERFTALMTGINRSIRRIKNEEMAEYDLKAPHVACLYYLRARGQLTLKELCELCEEDKANLSRTLDSLESQGYISCLSESSRRYRSPYALTEKGKSLGDYISGRINMVLARSSEGISPGDLAIMYACLERVNANLAVMCEELADK